MPNKEAAQALKFTKKPVTIEAVCFDGTNVVEIWNWMGSKYPHEIPKAEGFYIPTLEGDMKASVGDWIIKGVKGEFYPCKPDIFEATYTRAEALTDHGKAEAIAIINALGAECDRLASKYEPHPELPDDNSFSLSDLHDRGLRFLEGNKEASQTTHTVDLPYSTELSDKRVERFMEEFGFQNSRSLFTMLKQYENQIRHEIQESISAFVAAETEE